MGSEFRASSVGHRAERCRSELGAPGCTMSECFEYVFEVAYFRAVLVRHGSIRQSNTSPRDDCKLGSDCFFCCNPSHTAQLRIVSIDVL